MYELATTRFNSETWAENNNWRENNNWMYLWITKKNHK